MKPRIESIAVEKSDFRMPYSPVIRVRTGGDLLFISGATALPLYHQHPHEHDKLNPSTDVREQTRMVMENLAKVLRAAGASFSDVVRTDVFVTDMEDQDAIDETMGRYFQGNSPASTLIEVSRLVDRRLKLEVNAIAVVESRA